MRRLLLGAVVLAALAHGPLPVHADEPKDVESGLVGVILISRKGAAGPTGRPTDVDREFVTLFMIVDENTSWYLQHNIDTFTGDPKGVNKLEISPSDHLGNYNLFGSGFAFSNFRSTINGLMYANLPMMTMKKGERVRWYVVSIGEGVNLHTPHWHGNVVVLRSLTIFQSFGDAVGGHAGYTGCGVLIGVSPSMRPQLERH